MTDTHELAQAPAEPPKQSSAWNWPAEWAVEQAFWREVATRTIAGVLTVVLLGVPGLIYATAAGLLRPDQLIPILIGVGVFLGLITIYLVVFVLIRASTRRRIKKALLDAASRVDVSVAGVSLRQIDALARSILASDKRERESLEETEHVDDEGREHVMRILRRDRWLKLGLTVLTVAAGAILPTLF